MPSISKAEGERQYATDLRNAPQGLGATRTNLRRLLHSLDFVGWSSNEESGRLDRRALTRYAVGSANIFSRREFKEAETSAVSILIDCSGSMNAGDSANTRRIDLAQKVTVHLASILHKARVAFAITGFRSGRSTAVGSAVIESPNFLPFKPWGKSLQACAPILGSIRLCAMGSTPDYTAVANAVEELALRPEHRRILFILTDADGYYREHMRHLQRLADKVGVTIVAIGINSSEALDCFVNAVAVHDLKDLGAATFNQLLKAVRQKVK